MTDHKDEAQILIQNCRLSYFYGFDGYKNDDDSISYCTHAIIAADHPQLQQIKDLQRKVATDMWKDKAGEVLVQLAAQDRLAIHKGDVSKPGQPVYAGKLYLSCNSKIRPTMVDGKRSPITAKDDLLYSGAWANVIVKLWPQANQFGKRVNAQLMGVQFVKHDERLGGGGRVAAAEEFGVVATDADSAAPAASGESGGLL
jgi:hypothetical protein